MKLHGWVWAAKAQSKLSCVTSTLGRKPRIRILSHHPWGNTHRHHSQANTSPHARPWGLSENKINSESDTQEGWLPSVARNGLRRVGIHAIQGFSLSKFLRWMGVLLLLHMIFVSCWLLFIDSTDLQNAFVPVGFVITVVGLVVAVPQIFERAWGIWPCRS